ncbi:MAG: SPOR domain-containing protein [Anaerovoracaceae bacterium]
MAPKRRDSFKISLGAVGITVTTIGTALVLFASFMLGVMVGRNIESYPEKIARGIPSTIKNKMTEQVEGTATDEGKEDLSFTFYQTLTRPKENQADSRPLPASDARHDVLFRENDGTFSEKKPGTPTGAYTIQVAAFRDEASMKRLRNRLATLGYDPVVHESKTDDQGTWYRLRIEGFESRDAAEREASAIESALSPGLKCLILKN